MVVYECYRVTHLGIPRTMDIATILQCKGACISCFLTIVDIHTCLGYEIQIHNVVSHLETAFPSCEVDTSRLYLIFWLLIKIIRFVQHRATENESYVLR